jgi:ribosomal protein S18 acetylase RimI-like enzyme
MGYLLRRPDRPAPQFLLYELDVPSAYRRHGIARMLVELFLTEARAAGAHEVWVMTNEGNRAAMALYQKCGFVRINDDDVLLQCELSQRAPPTA